LIIDTHAHFVPPALLDDIKAQRRLFPSLQTKEEKGQLCFSFAGSGMTRPVMALLSDIEKRSAWMTDQLIDRQVVGGWLDSFGYELPAEEGADWSRFYNEHLLKGVTALPSLVPLATVPMQCGKHAATVLEEALNAGFHGAMIGTQPKGLGGNLDDPDLTPFWEAADAHKAPLFIHPMYGVDDDRLRAYGLVNALGRVTDTSIAVARLLFSGHLLKYSGVRLVLAHGGAALPMVFGRLAKAYAAHPAGSCDPTESFKQLYFDTVVFDVNALRLVIATAGADKVMLGTDYPFPIGDWEPTAIVEGLYVTAPERDAIAGDTAAALFNIEQAARRERQTTTQQILSTHQGPRA
jgi:aminocarboxymuconate-semialdehyde decarboxylase